MAKYTGIPCAACNNPFTEEDDVVVCPECGAPHHRECYREAGHCALQDQHGGDFVWAPPAPEQSAGAAAADGTAVLICPNCQSANRAEASFCQMCGQRLGNAPHQQTYQRDPYHQTHASQQQEDWVVNGVTSQELAAYVGSGSFYFLRQFKMLLISKRSISFNVPAFFFNYFYFFYRKMYKEGFAALIALIVTNLPPFLYALEHFKAEGAMMMFGISLPYNAQLMSMMEMLTIPCSILRVAVCVVCGLFANKLFLKKAIRSIHKVRGNFKEGSNEREYLTALYYTGRASMKPVILLMFAHFAAFYALGLYLLHLTGLG